MEMAPWICQLSTDNTNRHTVLRISRISHTMRLISLLSILCIHAAQGAYDPSFACCGGCSSSKRADAYNGKLATGSHIFIWDKKLKNDPAEACAATFPYDKALNEQEGDRRVRSGRRVGTSYPIDHDFDSLCCEQRGLCRALDEDATGKCRCVKKWGFTGDHCELSIYAVALQNNTALFPDITNLTDVDRLLPDLRSYILDFDIEDALRSSRSSSESTDNLVALFDFNEQNYRQYAWTTAAYFVACAVVMALLVLLHLIWSYCCLKCGCRKKDPRKQPRIYTKATKLAWGITMCAFITIGTATSIVGFLTVHMKVLPRSDAVLDLIGTRLPDAIGHFESRFLGSLRLVLEDAESPNGLSLVELQSKSVDAMEPHTFLDPQSTESDVLGALVFNMLDALANYSTLFPTVNNASPVIDCTKVNIVPSIVSRMTIGAATGCFRCKVCSQLTQMLDDTRDRWRRNAYKSQLDLKQSREQLLEFGGFGADLASAIVSFRDRINSSSAVFVSRAQGIAEQYHQLETETRHVTVFGLLALVGFSCLGLVLAFSALCVGILSNKRPLARTTCFIGEIACMLAIVMAGVLYCVVIIAHDGMTTLRMWNEDVSVLVNASTAAEDIAHMLHDRSLVEMTGMNATLAFSDTLRVPPHPTPDDDDPPRIDVNDIYDLPVLFDLETQVRDVDSARVSLFGWEPSFHATQYEWLHVWAFGNETVKSPYNQTLHQELLNSSAQALMDPDNDTVLVTDDDLAFIQSTFNESWRGVSDRGAAQNEMIVKQWFFVARLELQKKRLGEYLATIANVIASPKPLLAELSHNTSKLEAAEFELKASVEYFTEELRAAKLHDCKMDANCAWFRSTMNQLFAEFQELITHAEFAALCCAVSFVSLLLGLICAGCFANRLHRKVVKVYSAN